MATSIYAILATGLGRAVETDRISSPRFMLVNEASINEKKTSANGLFASCYPPGLEPDRKREVLMSC